MNDLPLTPFVGGCGLLSSRITVIGIGLLCAINEYLGATVTPGPAKSSHISAKGQELQTLSSYRQLVPARLLSFLLSDRSHPFH